MKTFMAIFSFAILLYSCNNNSSSSSSSSNESNDSFQKISDDILTGYLAWRPLTAINLGLHESYDGKVTDYGKTSLDSELSRLKSFDAKLAALDTSKLNEKD